MAQDIETEESGKAMPEESPALWWSKIEAAKEQSRESWDLAKMAWEEYIGPQIKNQSTRDTVQTSPQARYPIYWSSTKSIQPMLYSRTPIPVAEKAFEDLDDNIARVGCLGLERLSKYLMRSCNFDETMSYMRDTFIHCGKASNRVFCESEIEEEGEKIYCSPMQVPVPVDPSIPQDPNQPPAPPEMMTIWLDSSGQEIPETAELLEDEDGVFILGPALKDVKVEVAPLHYRDVLHNPDARWQDEISWMAYRSTLNKSAFRKKFGNVEGVSFAVQGDKDKTTAGTKQQKTPTAIVWEIWDKETRTVKWLAEGKKDAFLKPLLGEEEYEGEDPYGLESLFPSPAFILGTCGPDSLFPVPDYVQLRPFIEQLHGLADRLQIHVRALKTLGFYDAGFPRLKDAIDGLGSGQFAAVENFTELVGNGGLSNVLQFFPMREIAEVVSTIIEVTKNYQEKFDEMWGLPDMVRGASDPTEGYQKQQQKGEWLSLRATVPGQAFQRIVRDTLEIMCDLAIDKFPEQKLAAVMGVYRMPPEDQEVWPQVLTLLRDDQERKIRINIQTDSTILMNENLELEQRNYTAKIVTEGLASVAAMSQQDPEFTAVGLQALIDVVSGTQKGKGLEGMLRALQKKKTEQMNNPVEPPIDPKIQVEQMKQEGKARELQGKQILQGQKQEGELMLKQLELEGQQQLELVQAQADIETTMKKIVAEVQQSQIEGAAKIQIEQTLAELKGQLEILKAGAKLKTQQHDMKVKEHSTALDASLRIWDAKEARRLSKEQAGNAYEGEMP